MRWPGHGMGGIDAKSIEARTAPPRIVHWAGMKRARLRDMTGSDVLMFFEREYYRKIPSRRVV